MKTSNVDLVSKLVVFFTLRAVVPQADVLLGKPLDFRSFQSSLGLPIESLSLFSKNFFFLYEINFSTSYRPILYISLSMWSFDFLNFLSNLSRVLQIHRRTINIIKTKCFDKAVLIAELEGKVPKKWCSHSAHDFLNPGYFHKIFGTNFQKVSVYFYTQDFLLLPLYFWNYNPFPNWQIVSLIDAQTHL